VNRGRTVAALLLLVAALVALSTALVGPVTFLGLLVVALAEPIVNSRRHPLLLPATVLTAIIVLSRTVIVVLHDVNHAAVYADRIVAMKAGRIVADGAPAEVLRPDVLADVFGYAIGVTEFAGKPFVLHHL